MGILQKFGQLAKALAMLPFEHITGLTDDVLAQIACNASRSGAPCDDGTLCINGKDAISHRINHCTEEGQDSF